ncbi:MAG: polyprenyl synthetase family protein [Planctomycetes bacterium]|nr:polyprenyl synthetase family protein [Planctomycetota bacterium]
MTETLPFHEAAGLVRPQIDRLNRELVQDLAPGHRDMLPLIEHVGGFRGKQLRPLLTFLSGMAVRGATHGGLLGDDVVTVAKVVELLHTATLVHDDVLDSASMRRRIPTVNQMAGVEVAVLLGDYIYAKAFHMAVQLPDPTAARWLAETVRVICQGEITQVLHRFDLAWTEARYFQVIAEKTASLYAAACRLGGHYAIGQGSLPHGGGPERAGGHEVRLRALEEYGLELGIAFQIVDDCLDLDGDERVVGKSLGTDLSKGKITLPLLYLLQRGPGEAERLRAVLGRSEAEALRRLRSEFALEHAVAYALDEARRRIAKAQASLSALPAGPARDALHQLAGCVVTRRL